MFISIIIALFSMPYIVFIYLSSESTLERGLDMALNRSFTITVHTFTHGSDFVPTNLLFGFTHSRRCIPTIAPKRRSKLDAVQLCRSKICNLDTSILELLFLRHSKGQVDLATTGSKCPTPSLILSFLVLQEAVAISGFVRVVLVSSHDIFHLNLH